MNIYQHFRNEERDFIDQVLQWKRFVEDSYTAKLTDFLDPRAQQIVRLIIGDSTTVKCQFFGGHESAERKRALLSPDYHEATQEDFLISVFEVEYPSKFVTIEHPQVLGSLMSIGLKREKFGDILFSGNRIQIIAAEEIHSYLSLNVTSIGRAKVSLRPVSLNELIETENHWNEQMTLVSSLRLDAVVAAIFNLSRQKSQLLIEQGHVKVNFTTMEKTSFECGEFDLVSVRGFGRVKILSIDGKTKKDKWRIIMGKQK
jgi:RNA-binding protein YlmH